MVAIWTILLVVIAVAAVARRTLALWAPAAASRPGAAADLQALDKGFAAHPLLTVVHILPGLLFVLGGVWQFIPGSATVHRWRGRVVLISGLVVGVTALVMSPQMAIGGITETVATMTFGILFLIALGKAWLAIRRRQIAIHREWMIRAFAVGLAVAFVRPIVGVFFATRGMTHLRPHDFFGVAFWLGFTIQSIGAEVWIRYTRRRTVRLEA